MKKLYYIIGLLTALFVVSCSESLEETYDEFAGDGMIRYLGKCADVEVNPGWERLQVVWKHNIDAGVKSHFLPVRHPMIACTKHLGPVCSCTFFRKIFLCCNNVYYSGTAMGKSSRNCRFYWIFVRFVSRFFAHFPDRKKAFSQLNFIM